MTQHIRYLTAGESHGRALTGILSGVPAGVALTEEFIGKQLARRQAGYGRGGRMKIETDRARILGGVRWGKTLGSPIALLIENSDHKNWAEGMSVSAEHAGRLEPVLRPRPGHADLVGALKYGHQDVRNVLERSSARETAMKVALGAVARSFLEEIGIAVMSWVTEIGGVGSNVEGDDPRKCFALAEESEVRCPDGTATEKMKARIDLAKEEGHSVGGVFEVVATDLPVGLGSYVDGRRRLGSRIAAEIMAIQAIKGLEFGDGFETARRSGPEVMDEIFYSPEKGYYRETNHAGGLEGGMSTGMPLVVRAAMKPIPTQRKPLRSVNMETKEAWEAAYERSDVCAVPAAAVVAEAALALVLADAVLEKFGGDSLDEVKRNMDGYKEYLKTR